MSTSQYEFPLLTDKEIVEQFRTLLPSDTAANFGLADIANPQPAKWQRIYIDILCLVFELQEEQLTLLSFPEQNSLSNPDIQTQFMVYLRISKCMSRFLFTCRYTEFKLPDITNPAPDRLRKITSAIINFCAHREEFKEKSEQIERHERLAKEQCNVIAEKIEATRSWINERMIEKAAKLKVAAEKKKEADVIQSDMETLKESQAELDAALHHLKLRASEMKKANANEKCRIAQLSEEIETLNKNIVPSPQKLHREIDELKRKLETGSVELTELESDLTTTKHKAAQATETKERLQRVVSPLRNLGDAVRKNDSLRDKVKEMNDLVIARKDEYNSLQSSIQQLDRLEATKVERATKLDLTHTNKTRLIEKENAEMAKEKATLEKKLQGTDALLISSREPLLEIRRRAFAETKAHEDRTRIVRDKFEKVAHALKVFNERELSNFDAH